jgi:hypothetical protein
LTPSESFLPLTQRNVSNNVPKVFLGLVLLLAGCGSCAFSATATLDVKPFGIVIGIP